MSFGKRNSVPTEQGTSGLADTSAELTRHERLTALRDDLMGLLKTAGQIADAVRQQASVPMPAIVDEPDPETGPLSLVGFIDHFVYLERGSIRHTLLIETGAAPGETFSYRPQHEFHELTGRIMELNLFCQRAQLDDALAIALQSPDVPEMVDNILAGIGYFASFVEKVIASLPAGERLGRADEHAATIERIGLMAKDKMLAPGRNDCRWSDLPRPFRGNIAAMEPHDGDYFINSVYFPAELASGLIGEAATGGQMRDATLVA